jgi:hypothetical protein
LGDIHDLKPHQTLKDIVSKGIWGRASTKLSITNEKYFLPERSTDDLEVIVFIFYKSDIL